ncbi:MAG TPA: hypothetical protein PKB14_21025 [Rubrivivax sp.]|nr:hypothetical protein [Rubrivivax sp.]
MTLAPPAANGARQRSLEIQTGCDRVDIAEHALGAEQRLQPVGQAAGGAAAVVAAAAEEDVGHGRQYGRGPSGGRHRQDRHRSASCRWRGDGPQTDP